MSQQGNLNLTHSMGSDITKSVLLFQELLQESWQIVKKINDDDKSSFFIQNWLQANWEMVLEGLLNQDGREPIIRLNVYGDGAEDLHHSLLKNQSAYDRVSLPSMAPTHAVVALTKDRNKVECSFSHKIFDLTREHYLLERLVTLDEGGLKFVEDIPFDFAILKSGHEYITVPVEVLDFYIISIGDLGGDW